jgi:hypothetical protein
MHLVRLYLRRRPSTDAIFKALADPTRREILGLLGQRRQPVGDLASIAPPRIPGPRLTDAMYERGVRTAGKTSPLT